MGYVYKVCREQRGHGQESLKDPTEGKGKEILAMPRISKTREKLGFLSSIRRDCDG